jgi:hypothetical protein
MLDINLRPLRRVATGADGESASGCSLYCHGKNQHDVNNYGCQQLWLPTLLMLLLQPSALSVGSDLRAYDVGSDLSFRSV